MARKKTQRQFSAWGPPQIINGPSLIQLVNMLVDMYIWGLGNFTVIKLTLFIYMYFIYIDNDFMYNLDLYQGDKLYFHGLV